MQQRGRQRTANLRGYGRAEYRRAASSYANTSKNEENTMELIGSVIIVLIVICAVVYIVPLIPIPEPFVWVKQALVVMVVAGALIWLVTIMMGGVPIWRRVP
jgi:heme/copper-type cytochrome/quinol oxidase subunit 2